MRGGGGGGGQTRRKKTDMKAQSGELRVTRSPKLGHLEDALALEPRSMIIDFHLLERLFSSVFFFLNINNITGILSLFVLLLPIKMDVFVVWARVFFSTYLTHPCLDLSLQAWPEPGSGAPVAAGLRTWRLTKSPKRRLLTSSLHELQTFWAWLPFWW